MRQIVQVPAGKLSIDHAHPTDAVQVCGLRESVLAEGRYFITGVDEYANDPDLVLRQIDGLTHQDNSAFLVGRLNGKVVAALTIMGGRLRRMRHVGRLEIWVDATVRGGGIGRAMMDAAVEWCQYNRQLSKLSLSVFADNERAIRLYRSFGFVEEGRRVGEYMELDGSLRDDVLMYRPV